MKYYNINNKRKDEQIRSECRLFLQAVMVCFLLFFTACDKTYIWPTIVETTRPSGISQEMVTLNGRAIIDMYTDAVFEFGQTPEYGNSLPGVVGPAGEGKFRQISCHVEDLLPGTIYHYRLRLEHRYGVKYGEDVTFSTTDNSIVFNPDLQYGLVSDIDGNIYRTIRIGDQTWMAENLKTTNYNDGSKIASVHDHYNWMFWSSGAYTWLNNEEKYGEAFGALYNWNAVGSEKLCPDGWHVPLLEEWMILIDYLGGLQIDAGKALEAGGTHWIYDSGNNTNEIGFTALPAGYRKANGDFSPESEFGYWRGSETFWWSATSYDDELASYIALKQYPGAHFYTGGFIKTFGYSVRCVKDDF
jgi:uncharacterized protein (TIGR02145 family)